MTVRKGGISQELLKDEQESSSKFFCEKIGQNGNKVNHEGERTKHILPWPGHLGIRSKSNEQERFFPVFFRYSKVCKLNNAHYVQGHEIFREFET